jgi:hypothetical protein
VTGEGFAPGVDVKITVIEPTGTWTFGGPDIPEYEPNSKMLHTTADGRLGPWDLMYVDPQPGEGGDYVIQATDGDCTASVPFTLPTDGSPTSVQRCSVALDVVPDWGVTFNVRGNNFAPGADLHITVDEPKELWTWPGTLKAEADGTFGPFDLAYSEPVTGDGGEYVFAATDGDCTATVAFTLPEP